MKEKIITHLLRETTQTHTLCQHLVDMLSWCFPKKLQPNFNRSGREVCMNLSTSTSLSDVGLKTKRK